MGQGEERGRIRRGVARASGGEKGRGLRANLEHDTTTTEERPTAAARQTKRARETRQPATRHKPTDTTITTTHTGARARRGVWGSRGVARRGKRSGRARGTSGGLRRGGRGACPCLSPPSRTRHPLHEGTADHDARPHTRRRGGGSGHDEHIAHRMESGRLRRVGPRALVRVPPRLSRAPRSRLAPSMHTQKSGHCAPAAFFAS